MDCHNHFLIKASRIGEPVEQPNCEVCGNNNWDMRETTMPEKEYFKRMLKDPHGTIGYHVIHEDLV